MMDENNLVASSRPLPMRIWDTVSGVFKMAFGQLATKSFWKQLFSTMVKEMVAAFIKTLGGRLLTYGISREDTELKKQTQSVSTSSPTSAFSSNNSVSNYHRPDSSYSSNRFSSDYSFNREPRSYPSTTSSSFPGV